MAPSESCPGCGFTWSDVTLAEIPARLSRAVDETVGALENAGTGAGTRPAPGRWSMLEYGAHLRDVLISIRERIITASIEDGPTGSPLHRDERVDLGFYAHDTTKDVATELTAVAALFVRTLAALPSGFEAREFLYSPVTPSTVTIRWAGAQALHECEHHLGDVKENLALL